MEKGRRIPLPPEWHDQLLTVGVTGTDGKTSTVAMTAAALSTVSPPVARITSLGAFVGDHEEGSERGYSTFLSAMRKTLAAGGRFAVVEWASWSLANGMLASWPSTVGVVTNVTRDHFDYHGSSEAYVQSKAQLVRHIRAGGFVVLNQDDRHVEELAAAARPGLTVLRYGRDERRTDVRILNDVVDWSGTTVQVVLRDRATISMHLQMIGSHFAENAAAALAVADGLGLDVARAAAAIEGVPPPPGRFEVIARRPYVVVDFAHTPNGLRRTLEAARLLCRGQLSVVFGAGGNRDPGKRPLLGEAAGLADLALITSDNPRSEDPHAIIRDVRAGTPSSTEVHEEADREVAICRAIEQADGDDVIVIAGRGRDTHQLVGTDWRPMDDAAIARAVLARRTAGPC